MVVAAMVSCPSCSVPNVVRAHTQSGLEDIHPSSRLLKVEEAVLEGHVILMSVLIGELESVSFLGPNSSVSGAGSSHSTTQGPR